MIGFLSLEFWFCSSFLLFMIFFSSTAQSFQTLFVFACFLSSFRYVNSKIFYFSQNGPSSTSSNLVSEIANARQHIKTSLERVDGASALSGPNVQFLDRISALEKDNSQLRNVVDGLQKLTISLEQRLKQLEGGSSAVKSVPVPSKPGRSSFT